MPLRLPLRRLFSLVLTAVPLALPVAANADTTWTRVSSVGNQPVPGYPMEIWPDGTGSVVGAWVTKPDNGHSSMELVRFTPSRTADAANLVITSPPSLQNWDYLFVPQIVANPAGGLQMLFSGQFGASTNAPSGTNLAPFDAATLTVGAFNTIGTGTPDSLSAVLAPNGHVLWADNNGSTIVLSRDDALGLFTVTGNPAAIPGCCGYVPRVGIDRTGRVWLAVYSNATDATGVYMAQLGPDGTPVGPFQKAPESEASDNNTFEIGFACGDICRVSYLETSAATTLPTGRILTWAPGEAAGTAVAGTIGGPPLKRSALAFRPDGRLWVAWETSTSTTTAVYDAKLGDARGAGGRLEELGSPPVATVPFRFGYANGIEALPIGNDLLIVTNWNNIDGPPTANWANVVLEPGAVDTGDVPNPKVVSSPGGKLVYPTSVKGRCVRVRPVADKPARIWAQVFSGKKGGTPTSNRVAFRFTKPLAKSKCINLFKKPKGFYKGKLWHIKFEVRTGATAKPSEKHRPPWITQPRITIDA